MINLKIFTFLWVLSVLCLSAFPTTAYGKEYPTQHDVTLKPQEKSVFNLVENFMGALQRGNTSQAYHAYTSQEFREKTTYRDFQGFIARYPSIGRNKSVIYTEIYFRDGIASVVALLTSVDDVTHEAYFIAEYVSGRWRMMAIQLYPEPPNNNEDN